MEASVGSVRLVRFGPGWRHPGRPAELPEASDADRFHFAPRDRQLYFPVELVADIEVHDIGNRFATAAARQELDILGHRLRVDADAELVLHAENTRSDQHVDTERAVLGAHPASIPVVERKVGADELMDLRLHE